MDNNLQNAYLSTIKCYEKLEQYLFTANGNYHMSSALEIIKECFNEVNNLLFLESCVQTNNFEVELLQLRHDLQNLSKMVELKIKKIELQQSNLETDNKISKTIRCKHNEDRKLNKNCLDDTISSMEEVPRVSSLHEIAGLWHVKKHLKTLILLPKTQPQLFENRSVCNNILLFGPPGTGKTRIVHAIASEAGAKLYCVSAGSILSSYVGHTEKKIKTLFQTLKQSNDYCILFFDEVDAFCRKRTDGEQEHSRRMKTELMCQMNTLEDCKNLFVICATNCPWDLDTAILRRYHRRIYIPLPNRDERIEFLKLFTEKTPIEIIPEAMETLLDRTDGYSGSDLANLTQIASTIPLNELEETCIWKLYDDGYYKQVTHEEDEFSNIVCCNLGDLPPNLVKARSVSVFDLITALDTAGVTVSSEEVKRFEEFNKK